MKELLLLTLIFAAFGNTLLAQDSTDATGRPMRVRLVNIDHQVQHGYLYAFTDSSLLLSAEKVLPRPMDTVLHPGLHAIGYREMDHLEIYHRGVVWRRTLVGFGIGAVTGALIGLVSGDDSKGELFGLTAGEKAGVGGLVLGSAGMLVGFISGLVGRHTFYIGGNRKEYERMRRKTIARLL